MRPLLHISSLYRDGFGIIPNARGQRVPPGARHDGIYSSALLEVDFLEVFACQPKTESLRPCRALLELPLNLDRPRAGYPIYDYSQGCILTLLEDLRPLAIPYGGASLGEQRWQIIPDLMISATNEFNLGIKSIVKQTYLIVLSWPIWISSYLEIVVLLNRSAREKLNMCLAGERLSGEALICAGVELVTDIFIFMF